MIARCLVLAMFENVFSPGGWQKNLPKWIWVQNRRFELQLGPHRSVSVQIAILTVQNKRKPLKNIEHLKK